LRLDRWERVSADLRQRMKAGPIAADAGLCTAIGLSAGETDQAAAVLRALGFRARPGAPPGPQAEDGAPALFDPPGKGSWKRRTPSNPAEPSSKAQHSKKKQSRPKKADLAKKATAPPAQAPNPQSPFAVLQTLVTPTPSLKPDPKPGPKPGPRARRRTKG